MYELKKIGKVFTSKFVGTGPSSYKKSIYPAAVSQRLRKTALKRHLDSLKSRVRLPNRARTGTLFWYRKHSV